MSDQEIILHLWYVCDDLGFIYSLRARAYIGTGTDREKLDYLRKLASIDYVIASIFPIPEKYHIQGQLVFHIDALVLMNTIDLFQDAINIMQRNLPAQTRLDIPANPLVCLTPLLGDDAGNICPQIDQIEYL